MMSRRLWVSLTALLLFLIVVPLIWLVLLAWPEPNRPATTELVRLRNALLIEPSRSSDFEWLPNQRPTSFLTDQAALPKPMKQWLDNLPKQDNDWQTILQLAATLRANGPKGGALQSSSLHSFEQIVNDGRGYCADYIQVINALAPAAGIPVREWGMSFDGFGGWGHAFSEFYSQHHQQWVFVDVFNGFYVTRQDQYRPLSVAQLQQLLFDSPNQLQLHRLPQGRFGFRSDQVAIDYYLRGKDQFYLWWGTNPLSFDGHPLISTVAKLSRSLEQFSAILFGVHPAIKVVELPQNRALVQRMLATQYQLMVIVVCELAALVLLLVLWYNHRRNRFFRERA